MNFNTPIINLFKYALILFTLSWRDLCYLKYAQSQPVENHFQHQGEVKNIALMHVASAHTEEENLIEM